MFAYIKAHIGQNEAEVAPVVAVVDIKLVAQELVCCTRRTEAAGRSGVLVHDVATRAIHVRSQKHATCLTSRRNEGDDLDGRAIGLPFANGLTEHRLNNIGVRRYAIHPEQVVSQCVVEIYGRFGRTTSTTRADGKVGGHH